MLLKLVPLLSNLDTAIHNAGIWMDNYHDANVKSWLVSGYRTKSEYHKYLNDLFHETFKEYKINILYKHIDEDIELWAGFDNSEDEFVFTLRFI